MGWITDVLGGIFGALGSGNSGSAPIARVLQNVTNQIGMRQDVNAQNAYYNAANLQSQNFAREMYGRQRLDALQDFNLMNLYNSPAMQMQRFKDAGLNPNLIYGNLGSSVAANVRPSSPSTGGANFQPKNALAFYDIAQKSQQMDLSRSAVALNSARELLLAQQTAGQASKNAILAERVPYAKELAKYSVETARTNLERIGADIKRINQTTSNLLDENVRRDAYLKVTQNKSAAEIDEINKRIDILKKDEKLKQLEIEMRNKGMTFSDPLWQRIIGKFLLGKGSVDDVIDKLRSFIFNGISIF